MGSINYQGNPFFFNDTATTEIYTLSLHDALPISIAITVNSVNDVPVNTVPGAQTVNEDTLLRSAGDRSEVQSLSLFTSQLILPNGNLNVSLAGVARFSAASNRSSTLSPTRTQAHI